MNLHLLAVALVGVLAGAAPVNASVFRDAGAGTVQHDFLTAQGPSADAAACTASQCGLAAQKSAADALAAAAGARPALSLDRPSMLPDSLRTSVAVAKPGSDVEPVLFSVIAPSPVANGQLCMEEGNLLGLAATCARPPPSPMVNTVSYDCPTGRSYDRFGMKTECRISTDVPEPGTLLLLGVGLLGLAGARVRGLRPKGSATPL
jgi:hypothetical protein